MNASIFIHYVLSQGNFRSFSKRTQSTFRVSNHHMGGFLLAWQVLFFLLNIWREEKKELQMFQTFCGLLQLFGVVPFLYVNCVLLCLCIHKFFSLVRVTE